MTTIKLNGQTIDVDGIDLADPYKWAFCMLYAHVTERADELEAEADKAWRDWFADKTTVNMSKFLQIDATAAEMSHVVSYMRGLVSGVN